MKTAFFVMCILCASAGLGQGIGASLNAQPQVYAFTSHPEHASQQPMAQIQNLNGGDIYVYARGDENANANTKAAAKYAKKMRREMQKRCRLNL